jgi:hypothetical protein
MHHYPANPILTSIAVRSPPSQDANWQIWGFGYPQKLLGQENPNPVRAWQRTGINLKPCRRHRHPSMTHT